MKEELQRRLFLELINLPSIFLNNLYNIRKQMKRQNLNFLKPKVTLWWTCCFHFRQSLNMSSYEGVFNCHVWFYAPVPLIQDEFLPRGDDRVTLNLTDTNYHQSTTKIFNFLRHEDKKAANSHIWKAETIKCLLEKLHRSSIVKYLPHFLTLSLTINHCTAVTNCHEEQ